MLREISEEVRVNLKDRLRDIRHAVRRRRHDSAPAASAWNSGREPFPIREIEGLLGHAASAFDDAMSAAEGLVPRERSGEAAAKGFGAYFPAREGGQPLAGERAFRRDMYHLAKAVLAHKKIDGARVHEASFTAVHAVMRARHGDLLARLGREPGWTAQISLAAGLSSALLVEFLRHRPLRLADTASAAARPADLGRSAEISCLAPIALACGLATLAEDATAQPDLLEIATLATDARLDRIAPACDGAGALNDLTAIFATLLAHLP